MKHKCNKRTVGIKIMLTMEQKATNKSLTMVEETKDVLIYTFNNVY